MINRNIEESLDLVCVKVTCHDAVASCCFKHVCNELCSDRDSRLVLAVLSCPSEVRHYGDDLVSRCSLCRINHEKELKEVVCRRECRLDDEYSGTSDTFIVAWSEFSVAECKNV